MNKLLLTLAPALLAPVPVQAGTPHTGSPELLAIRARRAESISQGTLEYAVILIENGRIVVAGEDLPVERGIPIVDLPEGWTVMPGLVNAYSRLGLDSEGGSGSTPHLRAAQELYPRVRAYEDVLEAGVTTLGLYPTGSGIAGQAVAIQPHGDTVEEMVIEEDVYLKMIMRSNASAKKLLIKGFEDVAKHEEKVQKAREKWEKDQEKKKKSKSKKKDDKDDDKKAGDDAKKDDEKKDDKGGDAFVPPAADEKVQPFIDLLEGDLGAVVSITRSADYMHLLDAIDDKEFAWNLRIPISRESDIFYVLDKETYDLTVDGIGDRGLYVVVEPSISLHPGTMRQRNLPNELLLAGAQPVLIPRNDRVSGHESWLSDTSDIVAAGMDRQEALKSMTLRPAELLGLGEELGSLDADKKANLIFLSGDPFEYGTEVKAVMIDGEIVFGELE